jgi:protease-4
MPKAKKTDKTDSFFDKAGNVLKTIWDYISTGRDYFWKGVRFTLATGIFLVVVFNIVVSLISPLWQMEDTVDPTGKVVVFSPRGVIVDQPPTPAPTEWYSEIEGLNLSFGAGSQPLYYPYQDMLEYFEDFKNDDRVSTMIFDTAGLGVSIVYALPIARKIKEAVDAGKEIIIRTDYMITTDYLLASGASEISVPTYGVIDIQGFGGARQYLKNFFEKFLITPRIYAAGDFKTGPESYLRDSMSEEAKVNLSFYEPLWAKWKNFVFDNRGVDLQWIADESFKEIIDGTTTTKNAALDWGLVDVMEEREAFDERMIEKFGASEDDEEELNAVYYRDYLASFEEDLPVNSDNEIKVVTVEGTIMEGDVTYGTAGSDGIVKMLKEAHEDEDTKAIVLRVNSPGGSVVASDYMRWEIEKAQEKGIPVVVSMGTLAASGGYWISSLADKIYAEEDTITGSIGVYGTLFSFEKIYDWMGINYDGYSTTKYGAFDFTAMDWPEEFTDTFKAGIDGIYVQFTTQTAEDRGLPIETVREIAKGRVYSGEMALEIGLVDELGTLHDAVDYAASLAELEDFKVEHVIPPAPAPVNPFELPSLINSFFEKEAGFNLNSRNMYDNIKVYCLECEAID